MTEPVPDWAVNVPPTRSVHTIPIKGEGGGQGPNTSALLEACANIFGSRAFSAGLMEDGAGADGGPTGEVLQGGQNFADTLCGLALGGASTGTSPQTVVDGVSDTNNQVTDNPFVSGLLGMGGTRSNRILGGLCGLQGFLASLCGLATGSTDVSATTPTSVLDTAQATASTGHLMLAGRSKPTATGTDVLGAAQTALLHNTANHVRARSQSTAQSIVTKQENLMISQAFTNSYDVAIDPDGNWVHNSADGAVTLGCLQATANATQLDYVSNEIPVVAGENITLSCFAKCTSLAYTGTNPVRFGVQKYRFGKTAAGAATYVDVGGYDVDTLESPAATTGWLELAGTYTVPPGVDQLRFRFFVAATATSGTVKFDEANFLKTDLISDECVPGVGQTTDTIVTQLYGADGAGFTHNDSAVALANTAQALVSATSRIAALEAEGYTGAIAGDDFSWAGEIVAHANWGGRYFFRNPSAWKPAPTDQPSLFYYSGDTHDAVFVRPLGYGISFPPEAMDIAYVWEGTDNTSDTDYQLVQTVLSSAPSAGAAITLIGRANATLTSYDVAYIWGDGTWLVGYVTGTELTEMDSGTCATPGLGSIVSLYCGDVTGVAPRHFRLQVGTAVVADFDESGTGSPLGATQRKWGWGASLSNLVSGRAPNINQWMAMDA